MSGGWRERVPWQARIGGKLVLSNLPGGRRLARRLGAFRHGPMQEPAYAYDVFAAHLKKAGLWPPPQGFTCLELGPGESLFTAVIARTFGAARITLVDSGAEAAREPALYRRMAADLEARGLTPPDLDGARSLEEVLAACNAEYLTGGLGALRRLTSASFDLVLSQAVLEHVRRAELPAVLAELRRITKADGVGSHRIDLRDHLGGALNNLRFPEWLWESDVFAGAGFYTNRLQHPDLMALFREAGFRPEVVELERWEALPTPRASLARPFRDRPESELTVSGFHVLLHPDGPD